MTGPLGVILAGGLSRRMEGREKSLLPLNGQPLVSHVHQRLSDQVPEILLNANGDAARFQFLGLPVAGDTIDGFAGPLAGVLAGMRWAAHNTSSTHILTAAADTPFFPSDYAARMIETGREKRAQIVLAGSNGRRHPVFGLWDITLADALEKFLVEEEGRKVLLFVERYENAMAEFEVRAHDPFFNVNTPQDLAAASAILSGVKA